jgi:hypothetical protein
MQAPAIAPDEDGAQNWKNKLSPPVKWIQGFIIDIDVVFSLDEPMSIPSMSISMVGFRGAFKAMDWVDGVVKAQLEVVGGCPIWAIGIWATAVTGHREGNKTRRP